MCDRFFLVVALRTYDRRWFAHFVEVFVESAVTCNELNCGSIFLSVIDESCVEVSLDDILFLANDHLGVS